MAPPPDMLPMKFVLMAVPATALACFLWNYVTADGEKDLKPALEPLVDAADERTADLVGVGVAAAASAAVALTPAVFHISEKVPLLLAVDRVVYALRWEALTLLPLAAAVGIVGTKRFFGNAATLRGAKTPEVEMDNRFLQNTLEQVCLAIPAHLMLATHLRPSDMPVVPALCALFASARLLFWTGYVGAQRRRTSGPTLRSVGFALTYYPTLGAVALGNWLLLPAM